MKNLFLFSDNMDFSKFYKSGMTLGEYKEAYKSLLVNEYYYFIHFMENIINEHKFDTEIIHFSVDSNGNIKKEIRDDNYIFYSDYCIYLMKDIKVMIIYDYLISNIKSLLPDKIIEKCFQLNNKYKNIIYVSNKNKNDSEFFNNSTYMTPKYNVLCKYFDEFEYKDIETIYALRDDNNCCRIC